MIHNFKRGVASIVDRDDLRAIREVAVLVTTLGGAFIGLAAAAGIGVWVFLALSR